LKCTLPGLIKNIFETALLDFRRGYNFADHYLSEEKSMKIIQSGKVKAEERSGGIFIGTVKIRSLIDPEMGSKDFRSAIVTFPPGTRNKLHTHSKEQILFVIEGRGIVATENEKFEVNKGDIILISANEKHWHGATAGSTFSHLYVTPSKSKTEF